MQAKQHIMPPVTLLSHFVQKVTADVFHKGQAKCHLNLCKVGFLLAKADLANLGVCQDTDDCGLLPQLVKVGLNALAAISILLGIVAERLLLALVPTQLLQPSAYISYLGVTAWMILCRTTQIWAALDCVAAVSCCPCCDDIYTGSCRVTAAAGHCVVLNVSGLSERVMSGTVYFRCASGSQDL